MKPEEILVELKRKASPRTQKTLDAIYKICQEQEKRGQFDFSIATISRLGYERGVPKAQSLRNVTGEKYRALISAFEEIHKNKKPKTQFNSEHDWIEEINNPKHKILARIQAAELAAANKLITEIVPPGSRIEVRDYQNQIIENGDKFSDLERRALEYLISADFLGKWDFIW